MTGLIYGWMRYFAEPVDEYSVVNHAYQPLFQHLHILVAPLLVATLGFFWPRHAWSSWRQGRTKGRTSGILLSFMIIPMIFSGYLLQTSVSPLWRNVWIVMHVVFSSLWLAVYLFHTVRHWLSRKNAQAK